MRVGRGIGSGKGKTGGRGGKGQTARTGVRSRASKAARCRCIAACPSAASTTPSRSSSTRSISASVQEAIDAGKLDAGDAGRYQALIKAGSSRRAKGGVRLLGNGELKTKVDVRGLRASKRAIAAVEKAGGIVKILAPKSRGGARGCQPGKRAQNKAGQLQDRATASDPRQIPARRAAE